MPIYNEFDINSVYKEHPFLITYADKGLCRQCKIRFEANWIDDLPLTYLPLLINRKFLDPDNKDEFLERIRNV